MNKIEWQDVAGCSIIGIMYLIGALVYNFSVAESVVISVTVFAITITTIAVDARNTNGVPNND